MAEKIAKGQGWTLDDLRKRVSGDDKALQSLLVNRGEEIVNGANNTNVDPLLLLNHLATIDGVDKLTSDEMRSSIGSFTDGLARSNGDLLTAIAEQTMGPDNVANTIKATGALPQNAAVLERQNKILSGYADENAPLTTTPKTKPGEQGLFDEGGNPSGHVAPGRLSPDAPVGQNEYALRERDLPMPGRGETKHHLTGAVALPSHYEHTSLEGALRYDLDDGPNTLIEDMGNAFAVGITGTVTDTATIIGAAGFKLFNNSTLLDWGLASSEKMEQRFSVENPNFMTALAGGFGSIMVPMVGGGVGRMATIGLSRKLSQKFMADRIKKGLVSKLGAAVADRAGRIGFAAGAAIPETFVQSGNTYRQMVENGASYDAAWTSAWHDGARNIGILGVSDYFLGMGLGAGWRKILQNAALRGVSEGFQELAQGRSQAWELSSVTGEDFHLIDQSQFTEGGVGFVLGALVGTGAAAITENAGSSGPSANNSKGAIADASVGVHLGTVQGIQEEIVDVMLGADFKTNSPEESAALINAQIWVHNLAEQSSMKDEQGVPTNVRTEYEAVIQVLEQDAREGTLTPEEGRAYTMMAHALENNMMTAMVGNRLNKNHTLEEQANAINEAIDLYEKHGASGLHPTHLFIVSGAIHNLSAAGQMTPKLTRRLANAGQLWGPAAHLAEGRSAAKYAVKMQPMRDEAGKDLGWSVIYRASSGAATGELTFEGPDAKAQAQAEYRRLVEQGIKPEDFGVRSSATDRILSDEAIKLEQKQETAQETYVRYVKQIEGLSAQIAKLHTRMASPDATRGEVDAMDLRLRELLHERGIISQLANEQYKDSGLKDKEILNEEPPMPEEPHNMPQDENPDRAPSDIPGVRKTAVEKPAPVVEPVVEPEAKTEAQLDAEEQAISDAEVRAGSGNDFLETPDEYWDRVEQEEADAAEEAGDAGLAYNDRKGREVKPGQIDVLQHAREHWKRSKDQDVPPVMKTVIKVAKALGINVLFVETSLDADPLYAAYAPRTNTVMLRKDADVHRVMTFMAAHEVGHALHEKHRPLVTALLADLKAADIEIEDYLDQRVGFYNPAGMPQEFVADQLADVLLTERGINMIEEYIDNGGLTVENERTLQAVFNMIKKHLPLIGRMFGQSDEKDAYGGHIMARLEDRLKSLERRVREAAKLRRLDAQLTSEPGKYVELAEDADMTQYRPYQDVLRDPKANKINLRAAKKYMSPDGNLHVEHGAFPGGRNSAKSAIKAVHHLKPVKGPIVEPAGESLLLNRKGEMRETKSRSASDILRSRELVENDIEPTIFQARDIPRKPLSRRSKDYYEQIAANIKRLQSATRSALGLSFDGDQTTAFENNFDSGFPTEQVDDTLVVVEDLLDQGAIHPLEVEASIAYLEALQTVGMDTAPVRLMLDDMLGMRKLRMTKEKLLDQAIHALDVRDGPQETLTEEAVGILNRLPDPLNPMRTESIRAEERIMAAALPVEAYIRAELNIIGDTLSLAEARSLLYEMKIPRALSANLRVRTPEGTYIPLVGVQDLAQLMAQHLHRDALLAEREVANQIAAERDAKSLTDPYGIDEDPAALAFFGPLRSKELQTVTAEEVGGAETAEQINKGRAALMTEGMSLNEWINDSATRFYTAFVDRNHSMKMIVESLTDSSIDDKLEAGTSIYHNLKGLMTGWGSAADLAISRGIHSFTDGTAFVINDGHKSARGKTVKGLGEIIDEHGIDLDGNGWATFNAYLTARRVAAIFTEKPGQIDEDFDTAQYLKIIEQQEAAHPEYRAAARDIDVAARGLILSLKQMGNISDAAAKAMLQTEFYVPLHSSSITEGRGIPGDRAAIRGTDRLGTLDAENMLPPLDELSTQMAQVTHAGYSNYVKVKLADLLDTQLNAALGMVLDLETGRALHTRGAIVGSSSGGAQLRERIMTRVDELVRQYNLDEATAAGLKAVVTGDTKADLNHQIWLSRIDFGDNLVGFFREGNFNVMEINSDVAKAFENEAKNSESAIVKMAGKSTRLLRTGATLDPGFWARNFVRDVPSALIGAMGMITGPRTFAKFFKTMIGTPNNFLGVIHDRGLGEHDKASGTIKSVFRGDVDPGYLLHGGGMATLSSRDAEADYDQRRETVDGLLSKGKIQSAAFALKHPLQFLEMMSSGAETITRLTVYRMRYDQIAEGNPKLPPHIVSQMASLDSRDATLDFARAGNVGQVVNKLSPFWNAMAQGVDKMSRSFLSDPIATMTKGTIMITLPTMALYAMNYDQEWYRKRPTWEKNMFWMFSIDGTGENIMRVPKPFDWGMLFGSLPERIADQFLHLDPDGFADWMGQFSQMATGVDLNEALLKGNIGSLATGMPITPVGQALMSLVTGYDPFTQRQIIPGSLENMQKSEQYTHSTSWLSRRVIDVLENKGGFEPIISPLGLDQMIRQTTGGLGNAIWRGGSNLLKAVDPAAPKNDFHTKDFRDRAMLIGAFNVDENSANTYYSTKFHDASRNATEAQRTWSLHERTGNQQAMAKLKHLLPMVQVAGLMRTFSEEAKGLTAAMKVLEINQTMSPDDKQRRYRQLVQTRDIIYKNGLEAYMRAAKQADAASKKIKDVDKLRGKR